METPSRLLFVLLLTAYAMAIASTLCGALLVENGHCHRPAPCMARRYAAPRVHSYSSAPDYLTLIRMLMHGGAGHVKAD
jgi:hypothetical protein